MVKTIFRKKNSEISREIISTVERIINGEYWILMSSFVQPEGWTYFNTLVVCYNLNGQELFQKRWRFKEENKGCCKEMKQILLILMIINVPKSESCNEMVDKRCFLNCYHGFMILLSLYCGHCSFFLVLFLYSLVSRRNSKVIYILGGRGRWTVHILLFDWSLQNTFSSSYDFLHLEGNLTIYFD